MDLSGINGSFSVGQKLNSEVNKQNYSAKYLSMQAKDTVAFGNKEKAHNNDNKGSRLLRNIAALAGIVGLGFLAVSKKRVGKSFIVKTEDIISGKIKKPKFKNKNYTVEGLINHPKIEEFINSAETQNAKIVGDVITLYQKNEPIRVVTKQLPSGSTVTNVYRGYISGVEKIPGANGPFIEVVNSATSKTVSYMDGGKAKTVLTKYDDGSGMLRGYCSFADESGEYIQLRPEEKGWSIVKRSGKPTEDLPIEIDKNEKVILNHTSDGHDYIELPERNLNGIILKRVNEAEVGYPFGPNPFSYSEYYKTL